jgi:hypothetical protein
VATKRKGGSKANGHAGRVTPSKTSARAGSGAATTRSRAGGASAGDGGGRGRTGGAGSPSDRPVEPDLNVRAVDRLVDRVTEALPRGRVRAAFSGTSGLSPNAVTVVGALPGVVVVGVAVASHKPLLLVLAFLVMAATIVAVMKFGNSTRIVAEVSDELIVFTSRANQLEPHHRGPIALRIIPYFDGRWLKVEVGGEVLFVSKRAYGAIVRRWAGPDEVAEVDEVDGPDGVDAPDDVDQSDGEA